MDSVKYLAVLFGILVLLTGIRQFVMPQVTILSFMLMFIVICVVFNGIFLLLFGRTQEFGYLWGIIKGKLRRR